MRVIGTAGHVDHGKSTLVEALTGIHPDRLKEERERQMTIDLGFAWLTLPNGESVGVIDVPGHRDFIENMLAGVGGIDATLFVVAADEGVMPQTREHLAILDLLHIQGGIIALTKCDLVDAEWRDLVSADVIAAVRGSVLDGAPLMPVSARTGEGLTDLRAALRQILDARPPRPDVGRPRLPIDRVFSLSGFGTVVTGTLSDGALAVGDEIEVLPAGFPARIRGVQTHKTKIERATPGSRVALNLAGVEVAQLRRGMVVAHAGTLTPTSLVDVRIEHLPAAASGRAEASPSNVPPVGREGARGLPEAAHPLKHNAEVKFFVGAAEVVATARLLARDSLAPGESGWAQLVLAEPVVVVKGDRFVLRRPSPGATIGGGVIVDPQPRRRHRRRDAAVLARLDTLARGTPGERLLHALDVLGPVALKEALQEAGLMDAPEAEALAELRRSSQLIQLDGDALVVSRAAWDRLARDLRAALSGFHAAHPLRAGMPREELKSRLRWTNARTFSALIARAVEAQIVVALGAVVRLPEHVVTFTPAQRAQVDALVTDFQRDPYNTPSFKECAARVGEAVLNALIEQGTLIQAAPEVLFLTETWAAVVEGVTAHLRAHGKITVAELRDQYATSRKYALALMEHLDAHGVTRRVGDERVLKT
jgi:selenocysteine-specific elongation factor